MANERVPVTEEMEFKGGKEREIRGVVGLVQI